MSILNIITKKMLFTSIGIVGAATGCTIHPVGEAQERQAAMLEGHPFVHAAEIRQTLALHDKPSSDELVRYALLTSPQLEQSYWEWRSAIEQIPQDGTQATNLVLSAGVPVTRGSTGFNRTTITVANDPMADILWPSKLGTAAARALKNAKAAGFRFQKEKYAIRQKVLDSYLDYVSAVQLLALDRADEQILNTSAAVIEAGIHAGASNQSAAIQARNEAYLLSNRIVEQEASLHSLLATLNAAMGRDPAAALDPLTSLAADYTTYTREALLRYIADNPELAALDAEANAREQAIEMAKLQYLPDFSLSASSDLAGNLQNLLGSLTVPLLRYQAIDAAVVQAQANLHTTQAMRKATHLDLQARLISDVATFTGIQQQLTLLDGAIFPRAQQNADIVRASYETGRRPMSELFDAQRSVIGIERLVVQMKITREKLKADVEAVIAKL